MTFSPNYPNPQFYGTDCDHPKVRTEVDTFGRAIGYDVCLCCGIREYYARDNADEPRG
jgi:hypothetical protein